MHLNGDMIVGTPFLLGWDPLLKMAGSGPVACTSLLLWIKSNIIKNCMVNSLLLLSYFTDFKDFIVCNFRCHVLNKYLFIPLSKPNYKDENKSFFRHLLSFLLHWAFILYQSLKYCGCLKYWSGFFFCSYK